MKGRLRTLEGVAIGLVVAGLLCMSVSGPHGGPSPLVLLGLLLVCGGWMLAERVERLAASQRRLPPRGWDESAECDAADRAAK